MKPIIEVLAEALETDAQSIKEYSSDFKQSPFWDSLTALNLIVLLDQYYSFAITADQIKDYKSIEDLENAVKGS